MSREVQTSNSAPPPLSMSLSLSISSLFSPSHWPICLLSQTLPPLPLFSSPLSLCLFLCLPSSLTLTPFVHSYWVLVAREGRRKGLVSCFLDMCACVCLDSVGMCVRKSFRQSLLQAQSVCDGRWRHTWCWSIHGICSLESFVLLSFIFVVLVQRYFSLSSRSSGSFLWKSTFFFCEACWVTRLCNLHHRVTTMTTVFRHSCAVSFLSEMKRCILSDSFVCTDLFLSKHTLVFKFIFPFKCMRISIFADSCR